MKRLYIPLLIVTALVLAGMITGCKKDFLEKPKGGAITVDTIFHTQLQARYAIADMYKWCIPSGFVLTESADCREDALTDNVYLTLPGAAWVGGNYNYDNYVKGSMTPAATIDRGPTAVGRGDAPAFNAWYKAIRKANLVLANIDKVSDAPSVGWKDDVKVQAIVCRAMAHYSAFRMYGGVPIVTEVLQGDGNISIPRASINTLVETIVKWCDEAADKLPPVRDGADYGRVTKLAALALKARVLLYAASPLYNTPDNMKSIIAQARFGDARDSVLCYPNYDKERWK
jgi:hypothetical protein